MKSETRATAGALENLHAEEPEAIRVVIVDDHPPLRLGLRILLEQAPEIAVVGETSDGAEALILIDRLRPTVALLDCQLPGLTGTEVAAEIQRSGLPTRILALSAFRDERYVRSIVLSGGAGYLLKEEAPEVIVAAVRAVARGEGWFSPAVVGMVADLARRPASGASLTDREREVLRLIARGWTNKEIARRLQVAERTVVFHVGNVLGKLGVDSRVKAAIWAKDRGLDA